MAVIATPYQSSDEKMVQTMQGISLFSAGCFYIQYGAGSAIANTTTATSVFSNTPGKVSDLSGSSILGSGGLNYARSSLYFPANSLTLGTIIRGRMVGSIKNNSSTPNLTFDVGLAPVSSGTYTAIATTGAKAMVSTGTEVFGEFEFELVVTAIGASGVATMNGLIEWCVTSSAGVPLRFVSDPNQTFSNFDTTIANNLDAKITWGTAHANNSFTPKYGFVEIIG